MYKSILFDLTWDDLTDHSGFVSCFILNSISSYFSDDPRLYYSQARDWLIKFNPPFVRLSGEASIHSCIMVSMPDRIRNLLSEDEWWDELIF